MTTTPGSNKLNALEELLLLVQEKPLPSRHVQERNLSGFIVSVAATLLQTSLQAASVVIPNSAQDLPSVFGAAGGLMQTSLLQVGEGKNKGKKDVADDDLSKATSALQSAASKMDENKQNKSSCS